MLREGLLEARVESVVHCHETARAAGTRKCPRLPLRLGVERVLLGLDFGLLASSEPEIRLDELRGGRQVYIGDPERHHSCPLREMSGDGLVGPPEG